ncbi:MAG: MarR family winged helix-turn-helix transcriptional regulator [Chloroflexota bacterium]
MGRTSTDTEEELPPARPELADSDFRDQADFRAALRRFLRFSEDQARARGLTPQQHLLLLAVRGHAAYPNVSIGDVAEALQIRHHSASLLVDRCVRRGLLERHEDPGDRRRALVHLTDAGQNGLDSITIANRRQIESLKGSLFRESLWQALVAYEGENKDRLRPIRSPE